MYTQVDFAGEQSSFCIPDCNMDAFAEFLNDNYDTLDIWNMKEDEKVKVKEHFHKENVKAATYDISCDWIETVLEIVFENF